MALNAASLTRRIQVQRLTKTPNGGGGYSAVWMDHGSILYARRRDVSDMERVSGGAWDSKLVCRFVIRATSETQGIRRTDRLIHDGLIFEIEGIKELQDSRAFLEITAWTESAA